MVKEIKVFLPRTPEAQAMLEAFKSEINAIPKDQRPRLVIRLLNLKDPSKYKQWLENLEEVFGGVYVSEFKKYEINALPAVIVDGEKTIEGRYLNREEVKLLIQGLSPELASITPLETPPPEIPPVEIPEQPSPTLPTAKTPRAPPKVQEPQVLEETPPIELAPVEVEEKPIRPARPADKPPQTQPQLPVKPPQQPAQYPKPQPQPRQPSIEKPPQKTVIQPQSPQTLTPPQPQPRPEVREQVPQQPQVQASDLTGTCFTCLFYDKARNRCKLLHVVVPDPLNPPCGRRKPKA